jgi:DnaJ family protein C protein 9
MTQETLEPLDDLYDKFGLKSTATSDEIKKAYRKAALINHPDKQDPNATQQEKDAATEAFQKISHYYSILSDPIKRKRYDQTGRIDGLDLDPSFASWTDYFEAIFEKLTEEAIVAYEKQYRCMYFL